MSWAQRLKRVFGIDIDLCTRCGGKLEVIASIEEPDVIAKILAHLRRSAQRKAGAPAGKLPLLGNIPGISLALTPNHCAKVIEN
jgi:hypothetical protein